jgi:hypothetical protein
VDTRQVINVARKMVILQGGPLSGRVVYAHEKTKEYHVSEVGIGHHVYKIKDIFGQYKGVKNETSTDN